MHFVDEDDGAAAVMASAFGGDHHFLDFLDAGQNGAEGDEFGARFSGDQARESGLAAARRSPEKHRDHVVALDLRAQRLAGTEQVVLADEFVERARAHAVGERARALRAFVLGAFGFDGAKKIHRFVFCWPSLCIVGAALRRPRLAFAAYPSTFVAAAFRPALLLHFFHWPAPLLKRRWRAASYRISEAATAAFKESTGSASWMRMSASALRSISGGRPAPSLPMRIATGSAKIEFVGVARGWIFWRRSGDDLQAGDTELRDRHGCAEFAESWKTQSGTGGGSEGLRGIGMRGAFCGDDSCSAEGFGGAQNRTHVAGILDADENDDERVTAAQKIVEGELWRAQKSGDALRSFGGSDGSEKLVGGAEDESGAVEFGEKSGQGFFGGGAGEDGFEFEAGANRVGDEADAFEADAFVLRARGVEDRAEKFEPVIFARGDGRALRRARRRGFPR